MLKHYKAKNINGKTRTVHRLIMEQILGRELSSDELVHHIDGNKWNNDPSNLTIVTRRENAQIHATLIDKSKAVFQLDENGVIINKWKSAREAERQTGALYQNIYKCCRGKRKTAGGYSWKYAE